MHYTNQGGDRVLARRRELVDSATQMMVADEFYDGKPWVDLSEEELMQGLRRFAGVDMQQTSDEGFCRQIFRVLKMDASVPVDSTVFMRKRAPWKYLADCGLTEMVIEANDTERRQTAKRRDARSMAAAGTRPHGSAADEHDSRESTKAAGVTAEQNRRYDNNECFVCGKQGHKPWDCPQSQQGKAGKGVHDQSHGQTPAQQQQSTNGPAPHTWSKTTGMALASATPQASGYQTASKSVVTTTEPAAPEASTQNDEDYVYINVPREKMAPVDNGLTETVQHQVSHSAGPQNASPVLHTVSVQPAATASQQWRGDSSTIYSARAAVVPGRCGETIVNSVANEPHVEVLTQHLAGRLAVPGAAAAAEIKVLMESGSSITAMSEELVQALRGQVGMAQTALTQAFVGHARVVSLLGQECNIETQSCPLHLTIDTPWGPVRFTMSFIVLPGRGDVVIIGQKTRTEILGIDVMAQLKASVLKA